MFLPGRNVQQELHEKQRQYRRVEAMATQLIPRALQPDCIISVQEVQCGDPSCAPIDTIINFVFTSGGQGMFGLPMEAHEVTQADLEHQFPPPEILEAWHRGEEADWPPRDDDQLVDGGGEPPNLRFTIGTSVLCRVGTSDWSSGKVTQLWYREPNWPEGAFAPYKIRLDDGRDIFAPMDMDQIIKLNPDAADANDANASAAAPR